MLNTLWLIFFAFLKVGTFGYGGGPSMIPLVQREVVDGYHWMTKEEFIDILGMGNALPGPIAIKMSAYIGYRVGASRGGTLGGILGAALALLGTNLPGLVLMFVIALVYWRIKDNPKTVAALQGAKAAVIGLLLWTTYDLAKPVLIEGKSWARQVGAGVFRSATGKPALPPVTTWIAAISPWDRVVLALLSFVAVTFLNVHPALVIVVASVIGFLIY